MVYGTQITIVTGVKINQLITGGPHILWKIPIEIVIFPMNSTVDLSIVIWDCLPEGNR